MVFNYDTYVTLKKTGNSSYPITSWGSVTLRNSNTILAPAGASFGTYTILKNGSAVYNEDVIISSGNLNIALLINSSNFPDSNFRNYMLSLYPKGYLTTSELQNLTSLNVASKGISNMTGIEKLTYLKELYCYGNAFTTLNLNSNTALTYLDCAPNYSLTSLSISNCTNLETLVCYYTLISSLNLSNLSKLKTLSCYNTNLTSLTLTNKPQLSTVNAYNNTSMTSASITGNSAMTTLNIQGCTALTNLNCYSNNLSTGHTRASRPLSAPS